MLLKNAVVYNEDFEPIQADLAVEGEKIAGIGQVNAGGECLDLSGYTIIPGLIDMHIHGCAGFDASDGTPEALEAMSRCLVERGVTSFCPTSMTLSFEALQTHFRQRRRSMKDKVDRRLHSRHQHGRARISPCPRRGPRTAPMSATLIKRNSAGCTDGCGGVRQALWTSRPNATGQRRSSRKSSPTARCPPPTPAAGYDRGLSQAIEWGVRHTTHLYNAMSGLTHRAPGVVGAVFDMAPSSTACGRELICDGFHIHPAALRIAFHQLGEDGSVIVSDSMRAAGHVRRGIRPGRADRVCQGWQGPAGGRHHRRLHFQPV